jgi:hypothetical protein
MLNAMFSALFPNKAPISPPECIFSFKDQLWFTVKTHDSIFGLLLAQKYYLCTIHISTIIFPGTSSSTSPRNSILFSTKYPELIIPDERVCLPRISCQKDFRKFQQNTRNEQ